MEPKRVLGDESVSLFLVKSIRARHSWAESYDYLGLTWCLTSGFDRLPFLGWGGGGWCNFVGRIRYFTRGLGLGK
jgi:hypothetical protein